MPSRQATLLLICFAVRVQVYVVSVKPWLNAWYEKEGCVFDLLFVLARTSRGFWMTLLCCGSAGTARSARSRGRHRTS